MFHPSSARKGDDSRTSRSKRCYACDNKCKKLAKSFRDLGDARGDYTDIYNPNNLETNEKARFYRTRFCQHARLDQNEFDEKICFNHKKQKQVTRLQSSQQNNRRAYFSIMHHHESVLQFYGPTNVPNFISIHEAEHLGIYSSKGGEKVYTEADVYEDNNGQKMVALVPMCVDLDAIETILDGIPKKKELLRLKQEALKATTPKTRQRKSHGSRRNNKKKRKNGTGSPTPISQSSSDDSYDKQPRYRTNASKPIEDLENMSRKELANIVKKLNNDVKELESNCDTMSKMIPQLQQVIRHEHLLNSKDTKPLLKKKDEFIEVLEGKISDLKVTGCTRFSMSSAAYFKANKRACKELYGFKDFEFLTGFIVKVLGVSCELPKTLKATGGKNAENSLSDFEKVLLTMFFCQTNMNYDMIGAMFGLHSRKTVGDIIDKWMPILGEAGDQLSTFTHYLDDEALDELLPKWYRELELNDVCAVIDGKDFMSETVRVDRVLNCAQSSNKVNHSAFRLLTWSLPCGAVIMRTPGFFGRASEKAILRAWGEHGLLVFPKGKCILGDKGFDNTAIGYTNFNTTLHPSFLTNKQFNLGEVHHNIKISKKRYTSEVVYSRVTNTKKLAGILQREYMKFFDELAGWAHGLANICYGHLQLWQII